MKTWIAAVAVLTALGMTTVARAAPACRDSGDANVSEMSFDAKDPKVAKGLDIGLQLALTPPSFPAEDIAKNKNACLRGDFMVGNERWQIYGDDKDQPTRWATGATSSRVVFLAAVPDPVQAADWYDKYQKDPKTPATFKGTLYVIVVADGDTRTVYQFSRVIPDNYHLAMRMKAALEGTAPQAATMDEKTQEVTLGALGGSQSDTSIKRFTDADGTFFVAQADGSIRHPPSGLLCPARIGDYERKDLSVFNPAEGGLDLDCRYFGKTSWVTVFETRFRHSDLDKVFGDYLRDAQAHATFDHDLPPPGAVSTALPMKSAFWLAHDGSRQGMWVAAQGEWFMEIRVTYALGDEAKVAAFAQKVLDLAAAH